MRQCVVHLDEAARIGLDAGFLQAQVVRVRRAPDGKQQVAALRDGFSVPAFQSDRNPAVLSGERHAFRVRANHHALAFQDVADPGGDVVVLARQELRHLLDHGDLSAEAPVHLRELEADIAAADDDEVLGYEVHVHHRACW